MIEISHLYKRYHNHHGSDWVLRDIDLVIPDGVSVGLVGRNGAGKSTLLRLIGGMDKPDKGTIVRRRRVSWPIGLAGGKNTWCQSQAGRADAGSSGLCRNRSSFR